MRLVKNGWTILKCKNGFRIFRVEKLKFICSQEFFDMYEISFEPYEGFLEVRSMGQPIIRIPS